MSRRPGLERLLDMALLAYPRAFRRRFGSEIRADFRRAAEATPARDQGSLLRTIGRHVISGLSERGSAVARWPLWPHHLPHLYEPRGRRAMFWDTFRSDLGHALAVVIKRPLVAGLSVAALALGIGANSAIFTVVNGVLLQPLPYRDPGRLVMVWSSNPREERPQNVSSPANFLDYRDGVADIADLEAFASFVINDQLQTAEGPEKILLVNAGLRIFDILGRDARLGRAFAPGDTDVVVLSQGFWQRRFGGDPGIIGRTLTIGGTVRTVIGVMPEDFVFPYPTMLGPDGFTRRTGVDVWTPWNPQTDPFANRGGRIVRAVHYLGIVGRLHPDATAAALDARLSTLAARLAQTYPDSNAGWGTVVVPLHEQAVGAVRPALLVLLGGVAVVLLMACVNVAGLTLAQSVSRQREMAVRAALGAGRGRLVRQVLTESVLLSMAGAGLALVFVQWGVRGLVALAPASLPRLAEVQPDATVLGVTLGVGLASGVLIGLAPAWAAARPDLRDALQDGGRGAAGPSAVGRRLRTMLVVSEIALAVVLSVGAGLLLRSFTSLLAVDPGFRPQGLLTMQIELPGRVSTPEARLAYYGTLLERLRGIPGVLAAGGTTRLPLGSTSVSTTVDVEGRPRPDSELPEVQFRRSIGDYFAAMDMPIRAGRGFSAEDGPTTPRVTVINEAMAQRLFPGESPVGRRIRTGPNPSQNAWYTIVGVVGNVRHTGLEQEPAPEMYIPHVQGPPTAPYLVVRTGGDPARLAQPIRTELHAFDQALALYDMRTMMDVRSESVSARRFLLLLVGAFGVLALTLAAVGVYGVMALVVGERTREMGLRLALGAAPGAVLRMILGRAAALAAIGIGLGLAAAWLLTPLLQGQLFGVAPADPWTFAGVPIVLMTVAAIAALLPARRAMRVDPLTALRVE